MKTIAFKSLGVVSLVLILMSFVLPPKKIKIYLIGDSTVSNYPKAQRPMTGWGMPFANYMDATVTVDDRAVGGRSSRNFLEENRWKPIADSLNAGDYVFIQFGHNDEAKEPKYAARYTSVPDYKINLIKFITETRAKSAVPILVTPVSRLVFKNGIAQETHVEYTKAVFEVGEQYKVPVIDLDKKSRELYQQLGQTNSNQLLLHLDTAEHPNYPWGWKDNTHFNEYGARLMAEIVLNDIKEKRLELADRIVKGTNKSNVNPQAK